MAFMLARALDDKLVTHADIVEGITVEELASRSAEERARQDHQGRPRLRQAQRALHRDRPARLDAAGRARQLHAAVPGVGLDHRDEDRVRARLRQPKKGEKLDSGDHPSATNNTLVATWAAAAWAAAIWLAE
jgi:hypothetical protein